MTTARRSLCTALVVVALVPVLTIAHVCLLVAVLVSLAGGAYIAWRLS
jgi:hypothetical protein